MSAGRLRIQASGQRKIRREKTRQSHQAPVPFSCALAHNHRRFQFNPALKPACSNDLGRKGKRQPLSDTADECDE